MARRTLEDATFLSMIAPEARAEIVTMALDILHKDRAVRQGSDQPVGVSHVVIVPLAIWQAGLRGPRIASPASPARPRSPTPGDAA